MQSLTTTRRRESRDADYRLADMFDHNVFDRSKADTHPVQLSRTVGLLHFGRSSEAGRHRRTTPRYGPAPMVRLGRNREARAIAYSRECPRRRMPSLSVSGRARGRPGRATNVVTANTPTKIGTLTLKSNSRDHMVCNGVLTAGFGAPYPLRHYRSPYYTSLVLYSRPAEQCAAPGLVAIQEPRYSPLLTAGVRVCD